MRITLCGLVVVAALLATPAAPAVASSQLVYVGNAGNTVTSYPTSATRDAAPSFSLTEGGVVGSLAFDSAGDLWVGSGSAGVGGVLSEYTPSQLRAFGSKRPAIEIKTSVGVDSGAAFDPAGDLWVTSIAGSSVSEFKARQLASSGTKAPAVQIAGFEQPNGVAFDAHGDLWVSSYFNTSANSATVSGYTPSELTASGAPVPAVVISASATGQSLSEPARLTFDASGDLWVGNYGGNTVVEYTPDQLLASGSPAPAVVLSSTAAGSLAEPNGLGFDAAGDLWVVDEATNTVVEFSPSQLGSSGAPPPVDTITGSSTRITNPWVLVVGPGPSNAPANTAPPKITGKAKAGKTLSCSTGSWTNKPTGYTFQWNRNGVPLAGATGSTYTVQTVDEGTALTCTVTPAGGTSSATSKPVKVPIPFVKKCPAATGRISGDMLGLIRIGMTRAQVHHKYTRSSDRGKRYQDFFCLTPMGVRVGYASPKLLKTLPKRDRKRWAGKVVWASTSNPYYALHGVRPGESIAAAAERLHTEAPFHIGLNYWYLARRGNVTAVLKVRRGVVEELGIAANSLTNGRSAQSALMHSFY